jgi:hypothetical protein
MRSSPEEINARILEQTGMMYAARRQQMVPLFFSGSLFDIFHSFYIALLHLSKFSVIIHQCECCLPFSFVPSSKRERERRGVSHRYNYGESSCQASLPPCGWKRDVAFKKKDFLKHPSLLLPRKSHARFLSIESEV